MLMQLLIVPLVLAALAFILTAHRYRVAITDAAGTFEITCPRDGKKADVTFDTRSAARTEAFGVPHHLHLSTCTFWPERGSCDQRCIKQVSSGHTHVRHA